MILCDSERRWIDRALCAGSPLGDWFVTGPHSVRDDPPPQTQAAWDRAKAVCRKCPVLVECRRDTIGEEYGVWGGRDEHERWQDRRARAREAATWPPELRRAWGRILAGLKDAGVPWRGIRRQTGFGGTLAAQLMTEYRAAQPRRRGRVTDLPLPDRPDFPAATGHRDCWVLLADRAADAWARGRTPDGLWVFVQVRQDRRHSETQLWVPADSVRFHHPDRPVPVQEYVSRPDRGRKGGSVA